MHNATVVHGDMGGGNLIVYGENLNEIKFVEKLKSIFFFLFFKET